MGFLQTQYINDGALFWNQLFLNSLKKFKQNKGGVCYIEQAMHRTLNCTLAVVQTSRQITFATPQLRLECDAD